MNVLALGLDHTTAPVDLRGRFALSRDALAPTLKAFRSHVQRASEVAIVSTCNRTELFLGSEPAHADEVTELAFDWLAEQGGMPVKSLQPLCYVHGNADAARHAFRLASGLASMVVGETQILGQIKHAVREAGTAGTLGATLHQLFQRSFSVAKDVRAGTGIGMHTVSLSAAIVRVASRLFEDFDSLSVLIVGAGDMAAPVLAHLAGKSPRRIVVANRSVERGAALAALHGAESIGISDAMAALEQFDIVVSCTGSPDPLIQRDAVERALKARRHRPMLLVDLAVPRDIDPDVRSLGDVFLYTIDELSHIVQAGGSKRAEAVGHAETIIEAGVQNFVRWLDTRSTVPIIQALQIQAEAWRSGEVQRARRLLAKGESIDQVLETLSRGLTQKMLHGPISGLQNPDSQGRAALTQALSQIFLQCPMRNGALQAPVAARASIAASA